MEMQFTLEMPNVFVSIIAVCDTEVVLRKMNGELNPLLYALTSLDPIMPKENIMDWMTAALEEYKTLREESLASMKMQQSILAYGVAAIGVIITSALNSWKTYPLPEFIFLALLPLIIYLTLLTWLGEVARMFRAGNFLTTIEEKINRKLGDDIPALNWESWLRQPKKGKTEQDTVKFHYLSIFYLFIILAIASILLGNIKVVGNLDKRLLILIDIIQIIVFGAIYQHGRSELRKYGYRLFS
jgi:uncharacterized membrane protein